MSWLDTTDTIMKACEGSFGESVTYNPAAGGSFDIVGIYDDSWEGVDPSSGQMASMTAPMLGVRISDLNALSIVPVAGMNGDQVIARGKTYRIIDVKTDGHAAYNLILHEV